VLGVSHGRAKRRFFNRSRRGPRPPRASPRSARGSPRAWRSRG
jgi:hypothetical protein